MYYVVLLMPPLRHVATPDRKYSIGLVLEWEVVVAVVVWYCEQVCCCSHYPHY
jgi:hypothetical protein